MENPENHTLLRFSRDRHVPEQCGVFFKVAPCFGRGRSATAPISENQRLAGNRLLADRDVRGPQAQGKGGFQGGNCLQWQAEWFPRPKGNCRRFLHGATHPFGALAFPHTHLARGADAAAARRIARKSYVLLDASCANGSRSHSVNRDQTGTTIRSYKLGEVIGQGANGKVYKALNVDTGDVVAIKQVIAASRFTSNVQKNCRQHHF